MSIQRYLLLDNKEEIPGNGASSILTTETHVSSCFEDSCDTSGFDRIFDLTETEEYLCLLLDQCTQTSQQSKSMLFIGYGSKVVLMPKSLNGINDLFADENALKQKLYWTSINSLMERLLEVLVRGLGQGEVVSMGIRSYCEQEGGNTERKLEFDFDSLRDLEAASTRLEEFRNTQRQFSSNVISVSLFNKSTKQTQSSFTFVELSLCSRELSLEYDIIINHTLESIYRYICKGDQNASADCKVTQQISEVVNKHTTVVLVGYATKTKGTREELTKISTYIGRFKSMVEAKTSYITLKKWKPSFSKELKDSLEEQIFKARAEVDGLKTKLRVAESDVMKVWCGDLNLNKSQLFGSNIKKMIDYEEVTKTIQEIESLTKEHDQIEKEAKLIEDLLEETVGEAEYYGRRAKPVTQSLKVKAQFQEIRILEAEIQKKQLELRSNLCNSTKILSQLPVQSKLSHPKSAMVRKSEGNTLPRPLTGVPAKSTDPFNTHSNKVTKGSSFAISRPFTGACSNYSKNFSLKTSSSINQLSSSSSKAFLLDQNLSEQTLTKSYKDKFKIQRDSYTKQYEAHLAKLVQEQDAKIDDRRNTLLSAIAEAKREIQRDNKMQLMQEYSLKKKEEEEEMIRKQLSNNLSLRKLMKKSALKWC